MESSLFTNREIDIVKLLALGLTSEQIAAKLKISTHTVNSHRRNMLGKFCLKNTAELLKIAKDSGVV
ncbi:MAG: helix-turn-helix transcriptional regulator [Opitutaceae bacterium]|nr:helix-turn-helix transcriptional regulator [Cytophagales bacterium]